MGEPLLVLGVHVGKVGHVGQENVDLDHTADVGAGGLEDALEVGDAGLGLVADGALDQRPVWVGRDLARAVDCRGRLDGLGLSGVIEVE